MNEDLIKSNSSGVTALEMKAVTKQFVGTLAVDKVDFDVKAGEVHALIGENGAGKSTLMKMIAGSFDDYIGSIYINGNCKYLNSPAQSKKNGIEMIYQELSLALPLSIAENILVGRLPKKGFFLDREQITKETERCLKMVGLDYLDPLMQIEEISQHEGQLVEIAKALGNNPSILVMDEPTSALSREEVDRLFTIIHSLKKRGLAVVYISHHLSEIFEVADRVTVLRDGRKIGTRDIADVTSGELVQMMVGKSVTEFYSHTNHAGDNKRLRVENLSRFGFFHDVSFSAYEGEILGICGLSGAGRSELARVLVGLDEKDEGSVFLDGEQLSLKNMGEAVNRGIVYLTENRKTEGLALRLDIKENILAGLIPELIENGVYQDGEGLEKVKNLIDSLSIYPPDPYRIVGNLSGGNQQKVLLAKWMACEPNVLILDEPTRGVDIGAKMTIHQSIERLAGEGNTVILISSDLPELVSLSSRILIMRKGRIIQEMPKEECTEEGVLLAANGEGL
ncbi:MAG: sugar ABC transporter ATP-binding protein [Spirochaetales bacterium]|nr:sugar ABC transporter ATP-binding protein [Spirochaetales bacterium]